MKLLSVKITIEEIFEVYKVGWSFIRKHTLGQNVNAIKYIINKGRQKSIVSWNPIGATIVVESRCSNRCKYCIWHAKETDRPYWPLHLSYGDFVRIADVLAVNNVAHLHFCGTGEPLFNKQLFRMIEYAHKTKFTTSIMSNCSEVMTSLIAQIANSGITRFLTSIDSGFPDEYEVIRYGSKWKTVINNLEALVKEREKSGAQFEICVDCMAMRSNYKSYRKLVEVLAAVGVDVLEFAYLQAFEFNELCSSKNQIKESDFEIFDEINEAIKLGKKLGIRVHPPELPNNSGKRERCDVVWWKMMVNLPNDKIPQDGWIGNVSTHCMLAHLGEAYSFGNLLKQDFQEIWNGEKIKEVRGKLIHDAPDICKTCPYL